MPNRKLLIDASYIESGGGLVYLEHFIDSLHKHFEILVLSNKHLNLRVKILKYSILIEKEIILKRIDVDFTICISNVPSIFSKYDMFFFHQRYFIDPDFHLYDRSLKVYMKRIFFRLFIKNQKNIIVQTKVMQNLLLKELGITSTVDPLISISRRKSTKRKKQILFINDSVKHKKCNLNLDVLSVIVQSQYDLIVIGSRLELRGAKNLGRLSHDEVIDTMATSIGFITFSRFESLGLPVIEAALNGCTCIGPNVDYINELLSSFIPVGNITSVEELNKMTLIKSCLVSPTNFVSKGDAITKRIEQALCVE